MSAHFMIKNHKADSVIAMYVDEPIGMDHPLFMARFQSRMDAALLYQHGTPLQEAIQSTVKRMRDLFGDEIPEEVVSSILSLVYAENDALHSLQQNIRTLVDLYHGKGIVATVERFSKVISGMGEAEAYQFCDEFLADLKPKGMSAYKLRYELLKAVNMLAGRKTD